jgi:hypothetical protein
MHVQHLSLLFCGRWWMLLGIVRFLEDREGVRGGTLFVVDIHDDEGVDDGRGLFAFKGGSRALRTAERPRCMSLSQGLA